MPDHPKALWRRAAVRAFVGQLDAAEADFKCAPSSQCQTCHVRCAEVRSCFRGELDAARADLRRLHPTAFASCLLVWLAKLLPPTPGPSDALLSVHCLFPRATGPDVSLE